jgi:DNA-binding MarR family transcriptional regulator
MTEDTAGPAHRSALLDGPTDNVLALVHRLSNRIGRAFHNEIEARYDLTLPEWRILLTLIQYPACSAIEITNRWAMEKMSVSRAIHRLEGMGRIKRSRNKDDKRSYVLALTPKGRRLFEDVVPISNDRYLAMVSCLDETEKAELRRLLAKLLGEAARLLDQGPSTPS